MTCQPHLNLSNLPAKTFSSTIFSRLVLILSHISINQVSAMTTSILVAYRHTEFKTDFRECMLLAPWAKHPLLKLLWSFPHPESILTLWLTEHKSLLGANDPWTQEKWGRLLSTNDISSQMFWQVQNYIFQYGNCEIDLYLCQDFHLWLRSKYIKMSGTQSTWNKVGTI